MPYVFETYKGQVVVHVHPVDDLIEHELNFDECICGPMLEHDADQDYWLVIHHSLDGREYEYA